MEGTSLSATDSDASMAAMKSQASPDVRRLFKATVVDINLRPSNGSVPVVIDAGKTVYDLFEDGPSSIMDNQSPEVRWIHLPANNMAWIENLMTTLHEEQLERAPRLDNSDHTVTGFDKVLRDDVWKHAFHGRHSDGIHSRFMMPLAMQYSPMDIEGSESDEGGLTWSYNANVLALYMPYLHWESYNSWKDRQKRIAKLKRLEHKAADCTCLTGVDLSQADSTSSWSNEALLHQYLYHKSPLHDRRSLDQSYYYNLKNVTHRDEDQIIGQYTWKNHNTLQDPGRKMMMVDQLWMWVIDGKTIVTAFPETVSGLDDRNEEENGANVLSRLLESLVQGVQLGTVKSVNGIIALIIDHCTSVFHRIDNHPDLAFFEFFADEIGETRAGINDLFNQFRATSNWIENLWGDENMTWVQMSKKLEQLYSIKDEIKFLKDVEKITVDLDKIDFLCGQQEQVVQKLLNCCRPDSLNRSNAPSSVPPNRGHSRSITTLADNLKIRRNEWIEMNNSTRDLQKWVHSLLDLKQRQATVSEARTMRGQIALSAQQGNAIMVFTIFTVLLLPISVVGTIFGMNATEIVGNDNATVNIRTIIITMVLTTLILVLLTVFFAFFKPVRELTSKMYRSLRRRRNMKNELELDDLNAGV